jgi:hypothetical protein
VLGLAHTCTTVDKQAYRQLALRFLSDKVRAGFRVLEFMVHGLVLF